jgi:hypothetical protein
VLLEQSKERISLLADVQLHGNMSAAASYSTALADYLVSFAPKARVLLVLSRTVLVTLWGIDAAAGGARLSGAMRLANFARKVIGAAGDMARRLHVTLIQYGELLSECGSAATGNGTPVLDGSVFRVLVELMAAQRFVASRMRDPHFALRRSLNDARQAQIRAACDWVAAELHRLVALKCREPVRRALRAVRVRLDRGRGDDEDDGDGLRDSEKAHPSVLEVLERVGTLLRDSTAVDARLCAREPAALWTRRAKEALDACLRRQGASDVEARSPGDATEDEDETKSGPSARAPKRRKKAGLPPRSRNPYIDKELQRMRGSDNFADLEDFVVPDDEEPI